MGFIFLTILILLMVAACGWVFFVIVLILANDPEQREFWLAQFEQDPRMENEQ